MHYWLISAVVDVGFNLGRMEIVHLNPSNGDFQLWLGHLEFRHINFNGK